jgi:hypothetical protein
MTFTMQYSLLFITKDADIVLVDLKHRSAQARAYAIVLFTDELAATEFRDQHFPGWGMGAAPDEDFLAKVLTVVCHEREDIFAVAFDPYRMNMRAQTIPIIVFLEQLTGDGQ